MVTKTVNGGEQIIPYFWVTYIYLVSTKGLSGRRGRPGAKINHLSETPLLIIIQREFPQADKIKTTRSEDKFFK
jgi:hypothetical protein